MRSLLLLATIAVAACSPFDVITPVFVVEVADHAGAAPLAVSTVPAFQHTCNGTASRIDRGDNDNYFGIWVWAGTSALGASSTAVFVGDSTVTTTTGMPLCSGSSCPRADQDFAVRDLYCITAGTSIAVTASIARPRIPRRFRRRRRPQRRGR